MTRAARRLWLGACLASAIVLAARINEARAARSGTSERPAGLTLRLRMAPEYVIGLPFFVEVTLSNDTEDAEYYHLTTCNPASPFPVELTCTGGGKAVTVEARSSHDGERRRGFDLLPGEARTFVLDMSELEPAFKPGAWTCRARWAMEEKPMSKVAPIKVIAAKPGDAPLLARLRLAGHARMPSWQNLIRTPDAPDPEAFRGLSPQARGALAPYLAVREAVQGPEPIASFPLNAFTAEAAEGPWASEASVLGYELGWTRRSPDLAAQRSALLVRWPGVQFRVKEIEMGAGTLTRLRSQYRRERGHR